MLKVSQYYDGVMGQGRRWSKSIYEDLAGSRLLYKQDLPRANKCLTVVVIAYLQWWIPPDNTVCTHKRPYVRYYQDY